MVEIAGDIGGLRAIVNSLRGVVPEVDSSAEFITGRVRQLATDAGWSGDAADAFRGAWGQDAVAMGELSTVTETVAYILEQLANGLSNARQNLDNLYAWARSKGMTFDGNGNPLPGQSDVAPGAFDSALDQILDQARDAREIAVEGLKEITGAVTGDPLTLLAVADVALLSALLRGYYTIPAGFSAEAKAELEAFNAQYKNTQYQRKHTAGQAAKAELTDKLKQMRIQRKELQIDFAAAEKLADRFKGGRFLGKSITELAAGVGLLQDGSRLSRALDAVPGVDIVLAGLATWAQATDDHEKGWSWTHAILADGGSNLAGVVAGLATDAIPYAGPFLAPITGYGVGAFFYEATHEGHWTQHMGEDGWFVGGLESIADAGKATWEHDAVDMYEKVKEDVTHPKEAVSKLWDGVKSLF